MAFDSFVQTETAVSIRITAAQLIAAAPAPSVEMARTDPDRALAMLFVAAQDCDAVDVLTAH